MTDNKGKLSSSNFFDKILVGTRRLDDIVNDLKIVPDIIKIDVEGAELDVLKGARTTIEKYKPKIFLSIHSEKLERDCIDFLSGYKYENRLLDDTERPSVEYLFH